MTNRFSSTTFEETFTQFIKAMKITYAYVNLVLNNFFFRVTFFRENLNVNFVTNRFSSTAFEETFTQFIKATKIT